MASIKIMQGDSYAVFFGLDFNEEPITPDMLSDVEIVVGNGDIRKLYSSGEVIYDKDLKEWYFRPTQNETFALEPESYEVQARVKFRTGEYSDVKGITIGRIEILDANSEEVI